MIELLLAAAIAHGSVVALQPVRELWLPPVVGPPLHGEAGYQPQLPFVFDGDYEYLGTPDGLFRSESFADPTKAIERIAFEGQVVTALASQGDTLYVATTRGEWLTTAIPTLHRSTDHGARFESLAGSLRMPDGGYAVVSQIRADPGRLIIDAGGWLLLSGDRGDRWTFLFPDGGSIPPARLLRADCLTVFNVARERLILGSPECGFTFPAPSPPKLSSGLLVPRSGGWSFTPEPIAAPRDWLPVYAIHVLSDQTVFVSAGGHLTRSDDSGRSFVTVFPPEGRFGGPSFTQLGTAPGSTEIMVAGGYGGGSYVSLFCSYDGGWSWRDCTSLVVDAGLRWYGGGVSLIARDRAGNTLVVIRNYHAEQSMMKYAILKLHVRPAWPRRRSVLH